MRAGMTMDFPKFLPTPCEAPENLIKELNRNPSEVMSTKSDTNYYAMFKTEEDIHLEGHIYLQ